MGGVLIGILDLDHDKCGLDLKLPAPAREPCASGASGEDVVSQLSRAFDESLQVKDMDVENSVDSPLDANGGSNMAMTVMTEKSAVWEHGNASHNVPPSTSVKCLCKCATFPVTDHNFPTSTDSKYGAHASGSKENDHCLRSMSLPAPRKIVPAMKGTREKEGLPLRKLSVSWAPDVYDPPPSSVSHLPKKKSNQQYRNNKKHIKGKHKGKNSRGSGKKDKKHHREEPSLGRKFTMDPFAVADSEKKFTRDHIAVAVADNENTLSSDYKSTVELLDFDRDVDSPDSNCGSSFLRKSRGALHFSYAETT